MTSTSQTGRVTKPLQKPVTEASDGYPTSVPRTNETTSTFSFPNPTAHAEALDSMHLVHHDQPSLECESSQKLTASDKTDHTLGVGHDTVPAPRLPRTNWRAQYACAGWVSTPRVFSSEQSPAATVTTARSKQHVICHECYIWGHVAPECKLPLREQKQMNGNF